MADKRPHNQILSYSRIYALYITYWEIYSLNYGYITYGVATYWPEKYPGWWQHVTDPDPDPPFPLPLPFLVQSSLSEN